MGTGIQFPITTPHTTIDDIARAVRTTGCAWNDGAGGSFIIMGTRDQIRRFADFLCASFKEAYDINEKLLQTRDRILLKIPPCPDHGEGCMPYAEEWIEARKTIPSDSGYVTMLNQRAEVEQKMFDAARGKRPMPTQQELREWALRLGTPHDHESWGREKPE